MICYLQIIKDPPTIIEEIDQKQTKILVKPRKWLKKSLT